MHLRIFALSLLLLAACSSPVPMPLALAGDGAAPVADILLLGEQHDAPSHQETHRRVVQALAERGQLAALALEMAEQGASTAGLPADSSEEAVRSALHWEDSAWPWQAYGPAVMAAVKAGVPVLGANLPRGAMRAAMADEHLDGLLPGPALKAQQQAIRLGHCNQLPESQIRPMTRIQIARDLGMAQTLAAAVVRGKTVVLLAGGGHVDESVGIPRYVDKTLKLRSVTLPVQAPARDYCAQLERQLKP